MQSIHIYMQPIAMRVSAHVQHTHVASEPGQITSVSALTGKLCVLVAFQHVLIWILFHLQSYLCHCECQAHPYDPSMCLVSFHNRYVMSRISSLSDFMPVSLLSPTAAHLAERVCIETPDGQPMAMSKVKQGCISNGNLHCSDCNSSSFVHHLH